MTWDKTRTSLLLYLRKAIQDQSRYVSSVRHGNEITDGVRKTQEVDVQSRTVSSPVSTPGQLKKENRVINASVLNLLLKILSI